MTALSRESVVLFLIQQGGRVPNKQLVENFRSLLNEPPEGESRTGARQRFKDIVNEVATVREESGVRYVCLRRRYRQGGPDTDTPPSETSASDYETASESPGHSSDGDSREFPSPPSISVTEPSAGPTQYPREEREHGLGVGKEYPSSLFDRTPRKSRRGVQKPVSPQFRRSGALLRARMRDSDSSSLYSSSSVSGNEEEESSGAQGQAVLDPLEHAWMLSSCRGSWESLRELLNSEPGLITHRDFITGFSCLHWAAKHGQHELVAALLSYARQHSVPVNINARATGGYTALHLAAMHGHLDVIKLLIGAYDADVDIRDYSGRKAWQYLSTDTARDVQGLVGAVANGEEEEEDEGNTGSGRWLLSKVLPPQLIIHRLSQFPEDQADRTSLGEISRKGSGVKGKPRMNKLRFRTQIIHSNLSPRDAYDNENKQLKSPIKHRPKSNVFG
ncbi:hypothetical protein GDO86_003890 [Hymenochirus boettgeri]|uniref:SOWAHA-C winged helix-turn-helix domain-containing protein n=1 Tax=Hymenochirus boettgeri TaxID=247094 RepID=A0A8T2K6S8_9PIPI|nr:hypothetical protein GDO86_003890 [Hymenochirus boettgeri]